MAVCDFTNEQQSAISAKCPVLVSAAAGSGKTAVLTERVIRKLTDPVNPVPADRLLIVTFTNAAAAEMYSRIEKRLYEESINNKSNAAILKQKHLLGSADICTIDSFCINIVRENFEKCGVEPNFTVSDGSELKKTLNEILTKIVDEELENNRETLDRLFELSGCEYDDSELKNIIEELFVYSRQLPFPDRFFDNLLLPYKQKFDSGHPWYKAAFELAENYISLMSESLVLMADSVMSLSADYEKCDKYVKNLSLMFEEIRNKNLSFDELRGKIMAVTVDRITVSSKNGEGADVFKANRSIFSDNLNKLKALFSQSSEEIEQDNKDMLPALLCLVSMIKKYEKLSFEAFCEQNKLAFYHTEQLALSCLCTVDESGEITGTQELEAYLSKYDEVMVDEFQDVNDLQNMLFYLLSGKNEKLFVVGDIKQSIYRFRGSNLNNFLSKKKSYIPIDKAKENEPKKIILSDNFRSRKGVCDFVNYLFSLIMTDKTGEIEYGEEERLNPAARYPEASDASAELLIVEKGDTADDSLYEYEAQAICNYIKELTESGYKVSINSEEQRTVQFGDICILMDKLKTKAPILAKKLTENGIPVSFSNESFCETAEISLALSLLSVIDNPSRDIELLSVLMSPLFGFTPDDLAFMRAEHRDGNIYSALLNAAENGNEKAAAFLEQIQKFRLDMAILSLPKLVVKLIYDTGLLGFVSAMNGGKQRRSNLLALPVLAEKFDYLSAGDFVDYLRELPESNFKSDNKNSDSVSVMSMHKSKGLQFPVCIISDLSSKINTDDSISRVVFSESLGIGFKYFDERQKVHIENLGRKVISKKIFAENVEEKLRLLYVAMTRAKERLVLVSSLKSCEKTFARIAENLKYGEISPDFVKSISNLGDLILAGCLLHPDLEKLRSLADIKVQTALTESVISFKITDCSRITKSAAIQKEYDKDLDLCEKIKENIAYSYPFEELSGIEAKTSVSAVAKNESESEYLFADRPAFMNKNGMSSAAKGTAIHSIMQFIEFKENVDVDSEIERLAEWQFITEEQAASADRDKLKNFFRSGLYKRIIHSAFYKREMQFLTELPAGQIEENVSDKFSLTPIIVQGAVDLLFCEDDGLVVVDFKTDRVKNGESLISLYSEQLNIYASACERIFKKRVKEKIIYSFHLDEICLFS